MPQTKLCVILGAGASHDVAGDGSPLINKNFRPPLAKDLFNIAQNPAYWDVIKKYQGASFLAQPLATKIPSGEISLENELRKYSMHQDPEIRHAFKYIPAYLRDLLVKASYEYTNMPSSYIELVFELLAEHPHEVLFITLNYDTLLEIALTKYSASLYNFGDIESYVTPGRSAKVLKLHGSINWYRKIPNSEGNTWDNALVELDIFEKTSENEIMVFNNRQSMNEIVIEKSRLFPILTAPLAGKEPTDIVCPESHIEAARVFLNDCYKYMIIGTSGLDDDLLFHLDSMLPTDRPPLLQIVNKGQEATLDTWERLMQGVRVLGSHLTTNSGDTFNEGFRDYLSSKHFREFVEYS